MKRTTLFKTFALTAAMMLGGASSAWAQTTLYYRTLTGTESDPADAKEQAWSATDKDGTSANSWTGDLSNASISNGLKLQDNSAKEIQYSYTYSPYYKLTYDIVWNIGNSSQDSYSNISKLKIGNVIEFNWGMRPADRYGHVKINGTTYSLPNYYQSEDWIIHVEIDTYTNTLKALTVAGEKRTTTAGGTDYAAFSYNLNDITGSTEKSLTSTPSYSSIALGFGWGKGTLATTLKSVKIQETSQNVFVYTVNYISAESGSPVIVKSVSSPDYLGEAIPVQRIITGDDSEEYIVTGDLPSKKIADDTDDADINVINLNVRKRYKCNLIVKNSFDGVIDEDFTVVTPLEESEEFAHSWKYVFPLYKKKGSDYYKATLKSEKYGEEGTFEYDDITKTVEYTLAPFVCYVADEVSGTSIDYSNGTNTTIYKSKVSLGARSKGHYTITGRMGDSKSRTFYIYSKTGEVVSESLGSLSGKNGAISTQTIYLDNDVDELYLQNEGANTIYDYVVVERSHVAISAVDNLGYTFSSTLPLDYTDTSVRAYIAKYDKSTYGDVVKLTQVTKVPANTGVLIFSNSELTNQSIPVTTESTDDVTGNCLVAVSSVMTLSASAAPEGYENYVLAIEGGKAVFQLVKTNSASMSAGQAYLQIPKRTGEGARSLRIVFDDETTGVADVRGKMEDVRGDFFNLQGQRVDTPKKGLYIVNGKKVIVK